MLISEPPEITKPAAAPAAAAPAAAAPVSAAPVAAAPGDNLILSQSILSKIKRLEELLKKHL